MLREREALKKDLYLAEMANLANPKDNEIAQRLKSGKGDANDFYFWGFVDNIKCNKANLVKMSKAGKEVELLDKKRKSNGKHRVAYQCYAVYVGIDNVATPTTGLVNSLPEGGVILQDVEHKIFDKNGEFSICHSSFSLDNQAKKLQETDKELMWYAYLAIMPNEDNVNKS